VATIYNPHQYLDERRVALELWDKTVTVTIADNFSAP
jgi:hypothetical protein